MDVQMPGVGGLEATRQLCVAHPEARVIMLTAQDDRGAQLLVRHVLEQVAARSSSGRTRRPPRRRRSS
jgi:DNA-binding NarL/FixJ family response regulator